MHPIRARVSTRAAAAVAATALTVGGIMAAATAVSATPRPTAVSATPKPTTSATPKPKPSATPKPKADATNLSISNKVIAHGKHHVDAVTGVLTSDGAGLAGETVALEARMGTTPRWKVVATGATGTGGTITFDVTPKTKTQFKYVFAGDAQYKASHSNVVTLRPAK